MGISNTQLTSKYPKNVSNNADNNNQQAPPSPSIEKSEGPNISPVSLDNKQTPSVDIKNINRAKNQFCIVLIIWMLSLPVTIVLNILSRIIFQNTPDLILVFINIVTLILRFILLLGWIAVIILGVKWNNLRKNMKDFKDPSVSDRSTFNLWFLLSLVAWLFSWPIMLLIAMFTLVLPGNSGPSIGLQFKLLFTLELVLFIYGLFGWLIPLFVWMYNGKKKI